MKVGHGKGAPVCVHEVKSRIVVLAVAINMVNIKALGSHPAQPRLVGLRMCILLPWNSNFRRRS